MINNIIAWAAKLAVGKHLLGALAWAHGKLDGNRTEINVSLLAIVHGLKLAGIIPPEAAQSVETVLAGLLPVLVADRVHKVIGTVDRIAPEVPKS